MKTHKIFIRFGLISKRLNQKGCVAIQCRITYNKNRKYFATGLFVDPRTRQAIKAGVFHLLFNLITIAIGLLLFTPVVTIVERISATDDIGNIIANAHVLFNVGGVVLFLPFVGLIETALNKLIPDKI